MNLYISNPKWLYFAILIFRSAIILGPFSPFSYLFRFIQIIKLSWSDVLNLGYLECDYGRNTLLHWIVRKYQYGSILFTTQHFHGQNHIERLLYTVSTPLLQFETVFHRIIPLLVRGHTVWLIRHTTDRKVIGRGWVWQWKLLKFDQKKVFNANRNWTSNWTHAIISSGKPSDKTRSIFVFISSIIIYLVYLPVWIKSIF